MKINGFVAVAKLVTRFGNLALYGAPCQELVVSGFRGECGGGILLPIPIFLVYGF